RRVGIEGDGAFLLRPVDEALGAIGSLIKRDLGDAALRRGRDGSDRPGGEQEEDEREWSARAAAERLASAKICSHAGSSRRADDPAKALAGQPDRRFSLRR